MSIRKRHSIQELSSNPSLHSELEKVIRAFAGIQALPPSDPNSFYFLGGFHGEPFRGPVAAYPGPGNDSSNPQNVAQKLWWGGYCNHGNVLFPTWHRAYMHRVEKALQSIDGCSDVMLPFWDECFEMGNWNPYAPHSEGTLPVVPEVIPKILTEETITIDGKQAKNPLFSYTLQRDTSFSSENTNNSRFSKPKGYQTCRFPKRGIVCNTEEAEKSEIWNSKFTIQSENNMILNTNVAQWLQGTIKIDPNPDGTPTRTPADTSSVYSRFQLCLEAPNYTVFSNNTSQNQWIKDLDSTKNDTRVRIVSLESPHNSMHLAVGGFFNPGDYNANPKQYQQANGDMGDNETASFDPIFFFHHAFIDYVFWTWQKKHKLTKRGDLDVLDDYPGTVTDEGTPVGIAPGSLLDMDTPLYPFRRADRKGWVTSNDVTDILELGYEYGPGSLDPFVDPEPKTRSFASIGQEASNIDSDVVSFKRIYGLNRAEIEGSFVIRTIAKYGSERIEVGREAVLSRLNVRGCANCQTHLDAQSLFPVYKSVVDALGAAEEGEVEYEIELDTHDSKWAVQFNSQLSSAHTVMGLPSDGALKNAVSIARIESI